MRLLLKVVTILIGIVVVVAGCIYVWATVATNRILAQTFTPHEVDFPIPFPLDPQEVSSMGLTEDAARQLAQQRAVERGKHLVEARYTCTACHSQNFGGGTMVDAFPIGRLLGPNITTGEGSRTIHFKPRDWDRIVRHGVLTTGHPAAMPSEDFQRMTDQELSDVVSYIQSLPPVNNTVPRPTFGPVGRVLIATGKMVPSAMIIPHNNQPHAAMPPTPTPTAEFGRHLANVCQGCHGADFSGGPIAGGDPSWPPARNLTPDGTGLKGWSYEQFVTAVADSKRPDGTALREPMTFLAAYGKQMTDIERHALWAFLQALPSVSKTVPN